MVHDACYNCMSVSLVKMLKLLIYVKRHIYLWDKHAKWYVVGTGNIIVADISISVHRGIANSISQSMGSHSLSSPTMCAPHEAHQT